ncbi:glutathione S-transferase LANCL1 isoform X2 [Folsomia candida]|uniref:glutathione S-transferase LANCL1 isoform X2 n=1 Tax=Folsomia candida TaxID=158441 RepID=UPI001604E678|nr:glutathione S-transferase LANCL1 isoform X2 [Folsomia candida]
MADTSSVVVDTERFHKNPFLDKEISLIGDPFVGGPSSFLERLKQGSTLLLETLTRNVLEENNRMPGDDDYSVYTGKSGVILTYHWILSQNNQELLINPSIKKMLEDFVKEVMSGHLLRKKRITFLCGDAGPLIVAYLITNDSNQRTELLGRLLQLQDLVYAKGSSNRDRTPIPNELLYGRAGYLYSLLFLNQQFPQDPPLIPYALLSNLVSIIIEDGLRNNQRGNPPLHYEWHDKTYLGAAHGYVGILYVLLKARAYMKEEHVRHVKETLDWVMFHQFPSGNLRSSVGSKEDKLIHWCHDISVRPPLHMYSVFEAEKERYLSCTLACGGVIWTRGILKRSYSLCHGTAGNAYSLMALYKHTRDLIWLQRSCLFSQWCFSWGNSTRQPDRPISLFEGLAGSVYMLHDFHNFLLHNGDGSGSTPKFPSFELD